MAKISSYDSITPAYEDLIYLVDDPAGTPTSGKATVQDVTQLAGASLFVAANDATNREKAAAAYTCDGTNDEVQIQAAIDALPTDGGIVQLSSGTFSLSVGGTYTGDVHTVPYGVLIDAADGAVTLRGAGIGATTMKLANSQTIDTAIVHVRGDSDSKRINYTVIEGISFDGNKDNQSAFSDHGMVTISYCDNIQIVGCEFNNAPFTSLLIFRNSNQWIVTRCTNNQTADTQSEFRFETAEGSVFNNVLISDSASTNPAMSLNANTDIDVYAHGIAVVGNVFVDGAYGLAIGGSSYNTVIGNVFKDITVTAGCSITVNQNSLNAGYDAIGNIISNNVFYNVRRGVRLQGSADNGCVRNIISNNYIEDGSSGALGEGIIELSAAGHDSNVITNNVVKGATVHFSVTDSGTQALMRGNLGFNDSDVLTHTDGVGSTRPSAPNDGQQFFDTDDGIPLWYDGSNWIDAAGNTV